MKTRQATRGMGVSYKSAVAAETAIYGVSWAKVASPVLTRTDDAVGMVAAAGVGATPAVNDFDSAQIYKDFARVMGVWYPIHSFRRHGVRGIRWDVYHHRRYSTRGCIAISAR